MDVIFERTSVRRYLDKPVEADKIDFLLKAAMAAPSAGNQQPWEFYVVQDGATLQALSECSPYAKCTATAPLAIVPCCREDGLRFPGCATMDMSACTENILLEAVEQGLGAVWMAIEPEPDRMTAVTNVLGLSPDVRPFAIIAIGYPEKLSAQQDRFDTRRIHRIG